MLDNATAAYYSQKMNIDYVVKINLIAGLMAIFLLLAGCSDNKSSNNIKFAISAEYPPFEYYDKGEITGFDIELAKLIAKKLGKEAIFENMQFSTILAALQNGLVDAAISTITITTEREKNFDFSNSYYQESMAMVYHSNKPLTNKTQLGKKKIACQLGTTMEIWLKKHVPDAEILAMDSNTQAIEALKANHVDGALVDSVQAATFSRKNTGLSYSVIAQSDTGYGVVVKKGSSLRAEINTILKTLEKSGELEQLKQKWLGRS